MRTLDPTVHNIIANHPETIRQLCWNPEDGFLTFDNLCADPASYWLLHNGSREWSVRDIGYGLPDDFPTLAFIVEWSAPHVGELHTMSLPNARGNLVGRAKELIHELFVKHDFETIWGRTPLDNPIARKWNAKIGAEECGEGDHPVAGRVRYFRNTRDAWLETHWR